MTATVSQIKPDKLTSTLAHHDAAITGLTGRMGHLENEMKSLSGVVTAGFAALGSKLDRVDNRPMFDIAKTLDIVSKLAFLFGLTVSGIIWVTTGQFAGTVATQVSINKNVEAAISRQEAQIDRIVAALAKKGLADVSR